jgi:hypothetical protein
MSCDADPSFAGLLESGEPAMLDLAEFGVAVLAAEAWDFAPGALAWPRTEPKVPSAANAITAAATAAAAAARKWERCLPVMCDEKFRPLSIVESSFIWAVDVRFDGSTADV